MMLQEFDGHFREWVNSACSEWNYPRPDESYYARVNERLPDGLRELLGFGVTNGILVSEGQRFTLRGGRGPYQWFSRRSGSIGKPAPNWEYFIQVSEYIRLHSILQKAGMSIRFEDDLMDIAVYQKEKLFVCCEVKERIDQIQRLIANISAYQNQIDWRTPDRGNDPLRKAKYIMKHKPEYFAGIAVGVRFEYRVVYPTSNSFQLKRDSIPLLY
jgi:hypothetical protein